MELDENDIESLKHNYKIAHYHGDWSTVWSNECKEAFRDGFKQALDILEIKVDGINADHKEEEE